tara:strand:+ start:196 stop:792 length:597 start_codon:yes stop_codon:yes gene_type:complete
MKLFKFPILIVLSSFLLQPVKADFGDADFPIEFFKDGPKSYHDAWCRTKKNKCRVRFQGPAMWVEGQGGISVDQFITYRHNQDTETWGGSKGHYNYISYTSSTGVRREALFLFKNRDAQREFFQAFLKWKRQDSLPIPNFKYPNEQGTEKTTPRKDKGLNPYKNPPIEDWSETTTNSKRMIDKINCNSPVWKNKPRCN